MCPSRAAYVAKVGKRDAVTRCKMGELRVARRVIR
jgi:hypothetical protein